MIYIDKLANDIKIFGQ